MHRIDRNGLRAPARVIDVELTRLDEAVETRVAVERYRTIWCLCRARGIPSSISFWDVEDEAHITLREVCDGGGATEDGNSTLADLGRDKLSAFELTVVICTRDRPTELRRALSSLRGQSDTDFAVMVIDNAPNSQATAAVVEEMNLMRCEYVVEPRRGLSHARNKALNQVHSEFVAWIDDDEIADVDWVRRLKEGFAHECKPVAVCGIMLPAELESEAQVRFEQYGGFNKGRGISVEVLRAGSPAVLSPLYPLPAIGSGGNMAFQVDALRAVGGFDPYLGAGTRTYGGEETRVFASLLRSGQAVLHWPVAITWHFHRREMVALHEQFFGYKAGLSAFYASMVRSDPAVMVEIVRLVPHALRELRSGSVRSEQLPIDFPNSLLRAGRRGLLEGAFRYTYEALKSRPQQLRD